MSQFSSTLIDYHQVCAKQEKTLNGSQEKFELVQIRWESMKVAESAWEFQAKQEREFELSTALIDTCLARALDNLLYKLTAVRTAAPFYNTQTLKFKSQLTIAFSLPEILTFHGYVIFQTIYNVLCSSLANRTHPIQIVRSSTCSKWIIWTHSRYEWSFWMTQIDPSSVMSKVQSEREISWLYWNRNEKLED